MSETPGRALRMAYLVASVGGVLFFVMSVTLLGIWPKRVLEAQSAAMSPGNALGMSESAAPRSSGLQQRGLLVLPHAADSVSRCGHVPVGRSHAGVGRASRLSPSLGHQAHWAGSGACGGHPFRRLALHASVFAKSGCGEVGDAGLFLTLRRRRRPSAAGSSRPRGVPRNAWPRAGDCRA